MASHSARRPFGLAAWAAPYVDSARVVLGSSLVAPITAGELAEIAGIEPAELVPADLRFEYGHAGGSRELREAIAEDLPGVLPENIVVTTGAGEALTIAARTLTMRGDGRSHVIVGTPAHESVLAALERSGCETTFVDVPLDIVEVVEQIRDTTVAVFISSPHNPTGQVLTTAELAWLAARLADVDATLVVDEVFSGISLGVNGHPAPAASIAPNAITIGSLSKCYGLAGLRVGWLAGPPMFVDDVRSILRYTSRSPSATSEALAKIALGCRDKLLSRARGIVYDAFAELSLITERYEGVRLTIPDGGTAAFPEIDVPDVDAWCARLAEHFGVVLAPGNACFGIPGRVRINLGAAPEVRAAGYPLLAAALAEVFEPATR